MRVLIVAAGLTLGLAGCVSTQDTPEWFAERAAENDSSYPSLRSVPREHQVDTDAEHWAGVARDMRRRRSQLLSNERAQPAPAAAPAEAQAFIADAQAALEETRQSHEPN